MVWRGIEAAGPAAAPAPAGGDRAGMADFLALPGADPAAWWLVDDPIRRRSLSPRVSPAGIVWLERIRAANGLTFWGEAAALVLFSALTDPAGPDIPAGGLRPFLPPRPMVYGRARLAAASAGRVSVVVPREAFGGLARLCRREGLSPTTAAAALLELIRREDAAGEGAE